jgi:uncharacterized membrane protein
MASPASIAKHPIHSMLVAFPIGLWGFALVCDMVRLSGEGEIWSTLAFYSIAGGLVGAVLAVIPGFIDYLAIDEPALKRIANFHLSLGLSSAVLFALNLWLRSRVHEGSAIPFLLSIAGVLGVGLGGWLGGEMVYVKGMGVEALDRMARKLELEKEKKQKAGVPVRKSLRRAG